MAEKLPWSDEYPFLNFKFNTEQMPLQYWALLGECSSKIQHVSGTPLRKDVADELNRVFLAKGVHATTAIEGNTLSEEQVKQIVAKEIELPPTQDYLRHEVENIVDAYNFLVSQLTSGVPFHLTPSDFKELNKLVLKGLELEEGVVPGEFRSGRVGVSDYLAPPPEFLEQMVEHGCEWLNKDIWAKEVAGPFVIPILRAVLSHLYIAWMHPFGDGNGRTARLVEFDLLIRAGVPVPCAHLLSDHYNRTRNNYYKALSRARQNPAHFVCYAIEGLRDLLAEQIETIRSQQVEVVWENYVYAIFKKDEDSRTTQRRREVALALGTTTQPVPQDLIRTLTPKLALKYYGLTSRTLARDIHALRELELITSSQRGLAPNLQLVRAFMPLTGKALAKTGVESGSPSEKK